MAEPIFWLGVSLFLVATSLVVVMVAALPVLKELSRAARSAEKLFDTLARELPPTLESIRLTGLEISDLTDDISDSVQSAGDVVRQVDRSLTTVKRQAQQAGISAQGLVVGVKAAWQSLRTAPPPPSLPSSSSHFNPNLSHPPSSPEPVSSDLDGSHSHSEDQRSGTS